jgi:predicted O-methyltransferase YrrM
MTGWTGRAKPLARGGLELFARLTAPAVGAAARRGIGAEHYLRHGALPVPVHYYQPIFDAQSIPDAVWERRHDMPGLDFREAAQSEFLAELGSFGDECRWPEHADAGYYGQNSSFGYSSAALLHAVIRRLQPTQVVEVGAGMSTLLISAALARNGQGRLTTIDPNPREQVPDLPERCDVITEQVERTPLETFQALGANDLLFIDSSHAVRTGGDVNYLYLDVLPRIRPGVVVHIHDIQLPYEYPRTYSDRENGARVFWTEQYLLQAFLAHNPRFRILLAGHWIQRDHPDEFAAAFPNWKPELHRLTSSFYIQAVDGP